MDYNVYLKYLSRYLYWRCPKTDADEILDDYEEILSQFPNQQYDDIEKKFGTPRQVSKMMSQPKTYYRWVGVFILLTSSLFIPEILLLRGSFNQFDIFCVYLIFIAGLVLSLLWFRPNYGTKTGRSFPKRLWTMLLGVLAVTGITCLFIMGLFMKVWTFIPFDQYGLMGQLSVSLMGTIATIMGGYGLIKARLVDYRWCTLYVLGLSVLITCISVLIILTSERVSLC